MNIIDQIQITFTTYLATTFTVDPTLLTTCIPLINSDDQKQAFGDLNSNAPMVLAKILKRAPISIAKEIIANFSHPAIDQLHVAGAGFLNFYLTQATLHSIAHQALIQKDAFFKPTLTNPEKICLEFVSANPTGPLHFGHGRGGIIGDVLGNILRFIGHTVTKEFYINDAGKQINTLGTSFKIRCQQLLGDNIELPEDAYHGEYLIELAHNYVNTYGQDGLNVSDIIFQNYAKKAMLERITKTLHQYGITFDMWFSEKYLHESGAIEHALINLATSGYTYEQDGALWFKSTLFGDDKDRVVRKASGELTYVAADIAYMENKVTRGYDRLIMVLGHDHHSYATRMQGVRSALGIHAHLDVILYQLVKIKEGEQFLKLSKRAGRIISLDDVIETVGCDIARFFYLNRKADAPLDFDLALALTKSEENPVFYIQYAYVRTGSILQKASLIPDLANISPEDAYYLSKEENLLLKKIISLKSHLIAIETHHQTYQLACYTHELAQHFSTYYAQHKIINPENITLSRGRLALVHLLRNTIATCCTLLGITLPDRM